MNGETGHFAQLQALDRCCSWFDYSRGDAVIIIDADLQDP